MKFLDIATKILATCGLMLASIGAAETPAENVDIASENHGEDADKPERMNADELDKVLACAVMLVESQLGGTASVNTGTNYIARALAQASKDEPEYEEIRKDCKAATKAFEKLKKENGISYGEVDAEALGAAVLKAHPDYPELKNLVVAAANPMVECAPRKDYGVFSTIAYEGTSFDHFDCASPLGQRFELFGPHLAFVLTIGKDIAPSTIVSGFKIPLNPEANVNLAASGKEFSMQDLLTAGFFAKKDKTPKLDKVYHLLNL